MTSDADDDSDGSWTYYEASPLQLYGDSMASLVPRIEDLIKRHFGSVWYMITEPRVAGTIGAIECRLPLASLSHCDAKHNKKNEDDHAEEPQEYPTDEENDPKGNHCTHFAIYVINAQGRFQTHVTDILSEGVDIVLKSCFRYRIHPTQLNIQLYGSGQRVPLYASWVMEVIRYQHNLLMVQTSNSNTDSKKTGGDRPSVSLSSNLRTPLSPLVIRLGPVPQLNTVHKKGQKAPEHTPLLTYMMGNGGNNRGTFDARALMIDRPIKRRRRKRRCQSAPVFGRGNQSPSSPTYGKGKHLTATRRSKSNADATTARRKSGRPLQRGRVHGDTGHHQHHPLRCGCETCQKRNGVALAYPVRLPQTMSLEHFRVHKHKNIDAMSSLGQAVPIPQHTHVTPTGGVVLNTSRGTFSLMNWEKSLAQAEVVIHVPGEPPRRVPYAKWEHRHELGPLQYHETYWTMREVERMRCDRIKSIMTERLAQAQQSTTA